MIINDNREDGGNRRSKIELKRLYRLDAPTTWPFVTPSLELMHSSLTTNPNPYIERALRISSYRGDHKSKLISKQKGRCLICQEPLINPDSFHTLDTKGFDALADILVPKVCLSSNPSLEGNKEARNDRPQLSPYSTNVKNVDLSVRAPSESVHVNTKTVSLLADTWENGTKG